jgi:diaminopimelate decarboxylase
MIAQPAVPARVATVVAGADRPVCVYVYDTAVLRARAEATRAALPDGAELLYAVKANGHPAVVAALARCVDGLEVASGGELALAVDSGADRIAFGGPGKTDAELRAAVAAGVLLHVESIHELRRLALVAAGANVTIALRVNRAGTGVLHGSHRMTGVASPFGIDEVQLRDAVELAARLPGIDLVGFHLHAVSNNLDAAAHGAFVADALDWAATTSARDGIDLRYVNVGGGFGVDYTGSGEFDLPVFTRALAEAVDGRLAGVRLVFEPGRFLAAGAGWYAAEVLDLKRTHGRWFAVLRGGTHHFRLPAAWGYSHPFAVVPVAHWPYRFARPEIRDVAVDAAGELCTPRDVLTRGQHVGRLRVGDVLVFARAGAYGWDISHHEYLRHPHPDVLVLGSDGA